jgi:[glutamine synthetase] adenylyltransferase / [glutamine synthetase]-adenylyl-L-tyrosine phosphorylase
MSRGPAVRGIVDEAVDRCARPVLVRAALGRLTERSPDLPDRLATDTRLRTALIALIATSRSLTRLLDASPAALDILIDLEHRAPLAAVTIGDLVSWKRHELLRIAARDLTGLDDLSATGTALADLADDVLAGACALAVSGAGAYLGGDPSVIDAWRGPASGDARLAVIAMGKLGARELNYASDIDLLFVGEGPHEVLERQARTVAGIAGRGFRVDTALRPEGRDGPLVRSLPSFQVYWRRWAEPWERQALLKARPVAGDGELGAAFAEAAAEWLWTEPFDAEDIRSLRATKQRTERDVARRGLTDRDLKRGRGGIRDIEFTVQLLQLVHGHLDRGLRGAATLPMLGELAAAGTIDAGDADDLAEAYELLRIVEHRLQLEDEQPRHSIPTDRAALDVLARVLGFRGRPEADAAEQLSQTLVHHQLRVRSIHERVYFRPLLEAFAAPRLGGLSTLTPDAVATRLAAFGFTDAARTHEAVRELTGGLNRASRLMQQMLPLLLDWISASPNPDQGLLMLRNLLSGTRRRSQVAAAFRDSAVVAHRLCTLLGTSRLIAEVLGHHPDVIPRLADEQRLQTLPVAELVASAREATSWRTDASDRHRALRRWNERHRLGIAARDVLGASGVEAVGRDLTALAEASVEAALVGLDPQVPFAVLALGRFGGGELSYASDLDVIFVFGPSDPTGPETPADSVEARRIAGGLLRAIGGSTPAERLYRLDPDLRPEGRNGALVRSIEGYRRYWESYALVWERQAMIRARTVAGDRTVGQRLLDTIEPEVWGTGLDDDDVRAIRRMKARIERERIPVDEDPQFHLKLGRGSLSDVEFTAQLLQLRHGVRAPGTMAALRLLAARGHIDPGDADVLMVSYRFCERARNRWYLIDGQPRGSLPTAPDQLAWLARSLDLTPSDLREEYRRVTRRARRVVDRVFYGRGRSPDSG